MKKSLFDKFQKLQKKLVLEARSILTMVRKPASKKDMGKVVTSPARCGPYQPPGASAALSAPQRPETTRLFAGGSGSSWPVPESCEDDFDCNDGGLVFFESGNGVLGGFQK